MEKTEKLEEIWRREAEMEEEVSDQTAFQKQAFVPLLRVSTTGRDAISNGEVTGARKAKLTDLRWKRKGVFRGSEPKQGKMKVLFSTLLPKNATGYLTVTWAGKVKLTFCSTQSE